MSTGRFIITVSRLRAAGGSNWRVLLPVALGVSLALAGSLVASFSLAAPMKALKDIEVADSYYGPPIFLAEWRPEGEESEYLIPYGVSHTGSQILVTYLGSGRVDVFNNKLQRKASFTLGSQNPADLVADAGAIYAAYPARGGLQILDWTGAIKEAYHLLSGSLETFWPSAMHIYDGILYSVDQKNKQLMAISLSSSDVSERGEVIFITPLNMTRPVAAGGLAVTPDGRLLLTDIFDGSVKVFTCNGNYRYDIINDMKSAGSLAMDNLASLELLARRDSLFDTSGILGQGRFHIVDNGEKRIKVYDAIGNYLFTYGEELVRPRDIVILNEIRLILISDTGREAIMAYAY